MAQTRHQGYRQCLSSLREDVQVGTSPQVVSVPVVWVGLEDQPVHTVNQFLVQVHEGEVFLTLGVVTPPVFASGDDPQAEERLRQITYVPARPTACLAMTRARLDELIDALRQVQRLSGADHVGEDAGGE